MSGQRYQWGVRQTWSEEDGGHTTDIERNSEEDARAVIEYWHRRVRLGHGSRIVKMLLIRRPVGDWEEVA